MKALVGTFLTFVCFGAFAGGQVSWKKISVINVHPTSGISFKVEGGHPNIDNCKKSSWYRINRSSNYQQEQLSLLMMHYSQQKKIHFYISGCLDDYPKVSYIHTAH